MPNDGHARHENAKPQVIRDGETRAGIRSLWTIYWLKELI